MAIADAKVTQHKSRLTQNQVRGFWAAWGGELHRDSCVGPGGAQYQFSRDAQAHVSGFTVQAGRVRNVQFVKQPR